MIYTTREQFYTGKAWRKVSKEYAKSKLYLCERCFKKGLIVPYEEVHHKTRITLQNINDPAITLNWNNLECLCKKCHEQEHQEDAKKRYRNRKNLKKKPSEVPERYKVNQATGEVVLLTE